MSIPLLIRGLNSRISLQSLHGVKLKRELHHPTKINPPLTVRSTLLPGFSLSTINNLVTLQQKLYSTNPLNEGEKVKQKTSGLLREVLEKKKSEDDDKKEKEEAEKQKQNQIAATKYTLIAFGTMACAAIGWAVAEWGAPRIDEEGNPVVDEFTKYGLTSRVYRAYDAFVNYNEALKEPIRDTLLPDPLKYPYHQPKYTLVIEMNGILVHPDWTYKTGWRFKKRPFIDYFLSQLAQQFEIVIFTQDSGLTAMPIIDSLDPNQFVMYRLFRESTRYVDGVRVKDLNMLNRDIRNVIHIDWNEKACQSNSDNCLVVPKWKGDDSDKSLFDLAQFLRAIAIQDVDDVREVIRHYKQYDNPIEAFKERQRQLQVQEQEQQERLQQKAKQQSLVGSFKRK